MTTTTARDTRDHRFLLGLMAGAVIGAGLGMFFAPPAAMDLRKRLASSAKDLGKTAIERYQQASARVGAVAKDYAQKSQAIRDSVADSVVRGAQRIERFAAAARSDNDHKAQAPSAP